MEVSTTTACTSGVSRLSSCCVSYKLFSPCPTKTMEEGWKDATCRTSFRADRSAGAGHQHVAILQVTGDALVVQLHRVAAQQVLHPHLPQHRQVDVARQECGDARKGSARYADLACQIHDPACDSSRSGGHGDQHLVDRVLLDDPRQIVHVTEHAEAGDGQALLEGVVVQETDQDHPGARAVVQLSRHGDSGLARPHQQHPTCRVVGRHAAAFGAHADGHSDDAQRQEREGPFDQRHRSWETRRGVPDQRR